jgi:hypothetical protein
MSEEKIQLPDFLIADLYKGTLVELDVFKATLQETALEEQPAKTEETHLHKEKIKFLGENRKGVIIIVNQPEAAFLVEDDLAFLTNILKACKLNLADIAIINAAKEEINYEAVKEQMNAETFLLFDVEPSAIKLPFMIPVFQIQKYAECTIMVAPPFHLLNAASQDGKLLKTKLWMSLKKVFDIQ